MSRRGPAPSLTILPNQSGKIRLPANLWIRGDASRRQRKMAGSGRNGGYGEGMARGGTGTAKRRDSPGGESLDTRRRFAPQTKGAGSGRLGGHREKDGGRRNGVRPSGEIRLAANLLDTRRRFAPPTKGAGSEKGRRQRKRRYGREKYRRVSDSERIWGRRNGKKRNFLGGWRKRDADDEPCAQRARRGVR